VMTALAPASANVLRVMAIITFPPMVFVVPVLAPAADGC
jgi:hypothetical protein